MLPQANRASTLSNAWFGTDRVTRVNYGSYVVTELKENCVSGRAEDSMLFHKKLHKVQLFVKKIEKVPRCRRRVGFSSGETFDLNTHRVSRVNYTKRGHSTGYRHGTPDAPIAYSCAVSGQFLLSVVGV